ncbi:MAG TPA: hypothetical protein VFQ45_13560 [Longimicrobium sp.]|nr:hypothetical protein [Longimicrobium sp.]
MTITAMDVETRERLRTELEALEGVRRAVVDDDPLRVFVISDRAEAPTEMLVRSVLAREGIAADEGDVVLSYVAGPEPRRRVRFQGVRMAGARVGRAEAVVELEWAGSTFSGAYEGESGLALELRSTALATTAALESVLGGRVSFTLLGIKSFRAFDTDLVVVLLRTEGHGALVGASLATGHPHQSAALAVLNATNRVLGNYLANVD